MTDSCKEMRTLNSHQWICALQVVLFGLKSALSLFLRRMDVVTQSILTVRASIDDVAKLSKSMREHKSEIQKVVKKGQRQWPWDYVIVVSFRVDSCTVA